MHPFLRTNAAFKTPLLCLPVQGDRVHYTADIPVVPARTVQAGLNPVRSAVASLIRATGAPGRSTASGKTSAYGWLQHRCRERTAVLLTQLSHLSRKTCDTQLAQLLSLLAATLMAVTTQSHLNPSTRMLTTAVLQCLPCLPTIHPASFICPPSSTVHLNDAKIRSLQPRISCRTRISLT